MKHFITTVLAVVLGAAAPAHASWYWPFGGGEDSAGKPQRLHRLLENANDLIEQAEDASLEGDAEKALELYNAALTNLADVAASNPDRADTPEFAPLRNKMAATSAAIDSIRFDQVNRNVRAVAVTDTTELQRKYDEEQAKKNGAEKAEKPPEKKDAKKEGGQVAPSAETGRKPLPAAKAAAPSTPRPEVSPRGFDDRLRTALKELREKDYAAADLLLEELEKERKGDLNVLIMRAAAQNGLNYHLAARRTLEKAMRAHPRNYLPYYNLAYLMLRIEDEGPASARQYYELGRTLGGPRDERLERRLK